MRTPVLSRALTVTTVIGLTFGLALSRPAHPGPSSAAGTATLAPHTPLRLLAAGVPAAGTPVYTETFSHQDASSAAISVLDYNGGADAANQTYTADPQWTPAGGQCDGWILNGSSPLATSDAGCLHNQPSAWNGLQSLAKQLGLAQGQTAAQATANQALAEYTNAASGAIAAGTEFKTVNASAIPAVAGHYYAVSAYFAETNCNASHASETFSLLINGSATVLGTGLDPCGTATSGTQVSRLQSGAIQIPAGTTASLGLSLYNATATGLGNDVAFDLPQILDVTPTVDKSFSPTLVAPGQTSVLTLTVTNTSELMAKSDWGFVDTLPSGLTLADTTFGGTCTQVSGTAFSTTGTAGGSTITVKGGDLAKGASSCTITAHVTSATEATYTNSPTSNMTLTGLLPGAPATVRFASPRIRLVKALGTARVRAGDQFTMALRTGSPTGTIVSNQTNATTAGSGSTVTPGTGTTGTYVATGTTTYYLTEAAAGGAILALYNGSLTCTDSSGLSTGLPQGQAFLGSTSITPVAGADITCTVTNSAVPPTIRLVKALDGSRIADTDEFTVAIHTGSGSGPIVNSTSSSTTTGTGNTVTSGTGTTGTYTATAGTTYYLDEAAAGTTTAATYGRRITCTDANGVQAGLPANLALTGAYALTPVAGASISCTLTNKATRQDVLLRKVGTDGAGSTITLTGSQWQLQTDASGAPGTTIAGGVAPVPGQSGEFVMTGLTPGGYWLTETQAPDGYTLLAQPVAFTVGTDGSVTVPRASAATLAIGTAATGQPELTVHDVGVFTLPHAGGHGARAFGFAGIGLLVLAGAAVVLGGRRRTRRTRTPGRRVKR
ncbi:SpaA isopeptide-forming pilin-related protein [Nocardioides sp. BP30]|uniref:DUF7933 domain-containing protein n=1 Tax=Nocardioides sp. BP30 TaxID=3036374 RepID=UPI002468F3D4|nr:SpaA isopeptide-forming pilin-related protein [Nocardioides sp. BP30]WGL50372.1 SpaA isopeptide-forming pilin-related protein [Nocardioides sp. BP30]